MIYIDMDGVIADFVSSALAVHNFPKDMYKPCGDYHMENQLGVSQREFWDKIDKAGEDFWVNMEPFSWTEDLIKVVSDLDEWMILSAPSRNPQCLSGKMRWLHKQFGSKFHDVIFCPAKKKYLLADDFSILIDDSDKNCSDWGERFSILFPQPWNKNWKVAGKRFEYLLSKLGEMYVLPDTNSTIL